MNLILRNYKNIVILTGAGVSAASGIRTFRGANGLWNDPAVERMSSAATLKAEPAAVWKFWMDVRQSVLAGQPNPAHTALAELESRLSREQKFLLVTQNIDGYHSQAGSANVVELHGNLLRTRCSSAACQLAPYADRSIAEMPLCPMCGSPLRADVGLFGESPVAEAEWRTKTALRGCDLFVAVGISGTVAPAANFVRGADYAGARTIYINPEPMSPPNPYFHETVLGKAEEVLPGLLG